MLWIKPFFVSDTSQLRCPQPGSRIASTRTSWNVSPSFWEIWPRPQNKAQILFEKYLSFSSFSVTRKTVQNWWKILRRVNVVKRLFIVTELIKCDEHLKQQFFVLVKRKKNEYSGGSNTKHIQILDGCMWSVNGPDHSETLLLASLVNKFKFTWRRAFQWLKYIVKINTFFNKSLQFFPSKWSNWLLLRKLIHQTIILYMNNVLFIYKTVNKMSRFWASGIKMLTVLLFGLKDNMHKYDERLNIKM